MSKWNTPDWRNERAYPVHRNHVEWRWEFLRRMPEYRKDWEDRDNSAQLEQGRCADAEFLRRKGHPPPPDGFTSWRDAMALQGFSRDGRHRERWGVTCLYPPSATCAPPGLFVRTESIAFLQPHHAMNSGWGMGKHDWAQYAPNDVLVRFDLSRGIADQVRDAKNLLIALQQEFSRAPGNRRLTASDLVRLLRALDAKDSGARNRAIGEVLCRPHTGESAAIEAKRLLRKAKGVQLRMLSNWHLSSE